MADDESLKFSVNLKVPPLKIVLNPNQNNSVVNFSNIEHHIKSEKEDSSNEETERKVSTPSLSDLLTTSPSSESESLASNSTIISSEHQQSQSQPKNNDEVNSSNKLSTSDGNSFKVKSEKSSNNLIGKKLQDSESTTETSNQNNSSKDLNLNVNQRITRSSQRAAQLNKVENTNSEQNEDSPTNQEEQDKSTHESARKAKRRKVETQESEQEGNQSSLQPTILMAEICPADYQLPSQNSFELYRDIRKRPYKKLLQLNYIQPKMPHGFKDYLLNSGPYLLDGNKLGVGLNGAKLNGSTNNIDQKTNNFALISSNRAPLRTRLSNLHQKFSSQQISLNRLKSYTIPKITEAPKNLQIGSPLYELFIDQEKMRHQMRMQHLKERERSTLAVEQEILRAYNKAAIADVKQKFHLSACTYFYYQESYHYEFEEKTKLTNGEISESQEEVPQNEKDENEEIFLNQLQEIDDKWDKIKKDMLVRHKNEADSLYAVQSLEWEWKAKEIGACDVRVSLKIEPVFVPRVEIAALDY